MSVFFLKRPWRGAGALADLIAAAESHALCHGATVLEAYPVDPDAPSYRFGGFAGAFERAGYREIGVAGKRRHIMRKTLLSAGPR